MECKACPLNRAAAKSPKMEPSGPTNAQVYVLGSAPTDQDDQVGTHFSSADGKRVRKAMGSSAPRYNYIIRDIRPDEKPPTAREIACCRPSIERDIAEVKPRILITVGNEAAAWAGAKGGATIWRGRHFPAIIGGHPLWVYPVQDAALVRKMSRNDKDTWTQIWRNDIRQAIKARSFGSRPKVLTEADATKTMTYLYGDDGDEVRLQLALDKFDGDVAFDWETSRLRPYMDGARVLSVAISDGDRTVVVALDHPRARWKGGTDAVVAVLRRFLASGDSFHTGPRRVAHNAVFEIEWAMFLFGPDVVWTNRWDCTQTQAFNIDERQGALNLNFLGRQHFGLDIKGLTDIDVTRLEHEPLDVLLKYNGIDAWITAHLDARQRSILEATGHLTERHEEHRLRLPTLALAQWEGMTVDQDAIVILKEDFDPKVEQAKAILAAHPQVQRWNRSHEEPFNPGSPKQLMALLEASGMKVSNTKSDTLKEIGSPLTDAILSLREMTVLLQYVDKMQPTHPDTVLFKDGKVHTSFNHTKARSNRLTSSKPNVQNAPKRKHREIRRSVKARKGFTLVSVDFGQMEARCIAFMSNDQHYKDALKSKYDIHFEWMERVSALHPAYLRRFDGNKKKARGDIKNKLVFPFFFGASVKSVAEYCQVPEHIMRRIEKEFWQMFPAVKGWQRKLQRGYEANGYVETMTGFRRHGPMGWNEIINTPVQGTSSDIVMNAMARLSEAGTLTGRPGIVPILNVHDDLTYEVPNDTLEEDIETIIEGMLFTPFKWVTVPLCVEVEYGDNWADMTAIGDFYSDEV